MNKGTSKGCCEQPRTMQAFVVAFSIDRYLLPLTLRSYSFLSWTKRLSKGSRTVQAFEAQF